MGWLNSAEICKDFIEFLRDQFSTLAIAMEESSAWSSAQCLEEGPLFPPRPAAEVCEQLSALAAAHSDNPEMYVDVVARR